MKVQTPDHEQVGAIEDVVIKLERGEVAYAVLCFGGFLGMHEKLFAVPWNELLLKHDDSGRYFVVKTTRKKLKAAPGFDKDDWPDVASPEWQATIDEHYGQS